MGHETSEALRCHCEQVSALPPALSPTLACASARVGVLLILCSVPSVVIVAGVWMAAAHVRRDVLTVGSTRRLEATGASLLRLHCQRRI
jgi:hypothetical protein